MLVIRDYESNEYPLLATKVVNSELNGQEDIELTIHQQKNNNLDLKTIDKLWELDYNNITYKIVYVKQQTRGSGFYLNVRATPLFYWDFDKSIIHENHDGSHTANEAFRRAFEGSGYNYVLVDFSPSLEWEGFGKGATRLEMFKRLIDRYGYEFTINGSTVTMRHLVGNDTNFMYKYKLNASNVSKSTDASAMFTHIKGFGNFDEGEEDYFNNAKLKREFTSPLASILGTWEGKPIVDGRMTQQSTLDEAMQKAVEDSLEISVEGTLHDVREMGYDIAVPTKGDRVWLIDERIDLEQEIRLHKVVTTYDENDNIIACDVTFGSQSIGERHKASINSLSKNFADLLTGQLKLPIISLEKIGMDMINSIHAASSEIVFGDFGMQAISKTNPNHVFGVNSEGWYISQDGGATPRTIATAEGIYADALFAGTLWLTNDLNIESPDGYMNMTGDIFRMVSKNDLETYTIIEDGDIEARGKHLRTWKGASKTHDVSLRFENGYIRARNNTDQLSLYFSDYGISTYADAEGNNDASGSLLFRDLMYGSVWGLTGHSTFGAVALRSDNNRVVLDANQTVSIESDDFSAYVRPFKNTRPGLNEFQFYVKDNESSSHTDGALLYGNLTGGATHGSGIRFSKGNNENTVYATNINGDIGTGKFHATDFVTSSLEEYKDNINEWDGDALSKIKNTQLYEYNLKSEDKQPNFIGPLFYDQLPKKRHGLVIGDDYSTPEEFIVGDGISQYEWIATLHRSVQQLAEIVEKQDGIIRELQKYLSEKEHDEIINDDLRQSTDT